MKSDNLSPLATLIAENASVEELLAYFDSTIEVYMENVLLPAEELQEVCDFLGVNPVFDEDIVLHGPGGPISYLERHRIEAHMRRTMNL